MIASKGKSKVIQKNTGLNYDILTQCANTAWCITGFLLNIYTRYAVVGNYLQPDEVHYFQFACRNHLQPVGLHQFLFKCNQVWEWRVALQWTSIQHLVEGKTVSISHGICAQFCFALFVELIQSVLSEFVRFVCPHCSGCDCPNSI